MNDEWKTIGGVLGIIASIATVIASWSAIQPFVMWILIVAVGFYSVYFLIVLIVKIFDIGQ